MHAPIAQELRSAGCDSHRRIGLVVDHPLRDLDGMCLVAQILAEQGHQAVLLPFYTQHFDLSNVELDLIVLNYARPANRALTEAASARGIALAVLDTEGGLIPEKGPTSATGIASFLQESGLDEALSLYLFWGEHLRDAVVGGTALPPDRAIVTGCPRFDLARRAGGSRARQVLVNTNFPVVNSAHATGSEIDGKALRSVGFKQTEITELAASVRLVMGRMVETILALGRARPGLKFVVRPHPFERADPYIAAFADLPNVSVAREGTAMEAIAASDCMLHVNCTTAIEAHLSGIAPISLDYINEPRLRAMALLPSQISHSARSQSEALAMIDCPARLPPGQGSELIAPFFGPLDGNAAMRVVNALTEVPVRTARIPHGHASSWRHRLAAGLGAVIGSGVIEYARSVRAPARKTKGFSQAEVRARITAIAAERGTNPAKIEQSRSALGLPTMALKVSPK